MYNHYIYDIITGMDADQLSRLAMRKTIELCSDWLTELPSMPQSTNDHPVYVHAIKNIRRKMEDKHSTIHDLNLLFNIQVTMATTSPNSRQGKLIIYGHNFLNNGQI